MAGRSHQLAFASFRPSAYVLFKLHGLMSVASGIYIFLASGLGFFRPLAEVFGSLAFVLIRL